MSDVVSSIDRLGETVHALPRKSYQIYSLHMAVRKSWHKRNVPWLFSGLALVVLGWVTGGFRLMMRSLVDARVEAVIDGRITTSKAMEGIQKQLEKMNDQLASIDGRLNKIEGWKEGLSSDVRVLKQNQSSQEKRIAQQEAVLRVDNPARVLAIIRMEIEGTLGNPRIIPMSRVSDYKTAVLFAPRGTPGYWQTVNDVVNCESAARQMNGLAPDPIKIAKRCATTGGSHNVFEGSPGMIISECIVDLDSQIFN